MSGNCQATSAAGSTWLASTMPVPSTSSGRARSRSSAAPTIIAAPSPVSTWWIMGVGRPFSTGLMTSWSTATSSTPRRIQWPAIFAWLQPALPRTSAKRIIPAPVRKKKTGAQKWVMNRVRNELALSYWGSAESQISSGCGISIMRM